MSHPHDALLETVGETAPAETAEQKKARLAAEKAAEKEAKAKEAETKRAEAAKVKQAEREAKAKEAETKRAEAAKLKQAEREEKAKAKQAEQAVKALEKQEAAKVAAEAKALAKLEADAAKIEAKAKADADKAQAKLDAKAARDQAVADRKQALADRKASLKAEEGRRPRSTHAQFHFELGLSQPQTFSVRCMVFNVLKEMQAERLEAIELGNVAASEVELYDIKDINERCQSFLYGESCRAFLSKLEEANHITMVSVDAPAVPAAEDEQTDGGEEE